MRINRGQSERASARLFTGFLRAIRPYGAEFRRVEIILPKSIHVMRKDRCFSVAKCQLTDWTLLLLGGVSFGPPIRRPVEGPPGEYG